MILRYQASNNVVVLLYKLLSFVFLIQSVQGFGWTKWNQDLLQGVSDCPTFDGNRTGICVASAAECRNSKYKW